MYKILTHKDVDGLTAAHLFSVAHPGEIQSVDIPEVFGDFPELTDDEYIMLDMRPSRPGFKGTVYDHHLGYDEEGFREGDRAFQLVWKDMPASGIIYEEFKDKIPKEERWKVAIGYVGDGASNKIPIEVWVENPELLDVVLYLYEYRGDVGATRLKLYKTLSSPLNAACKIGQPRTALELLAKARAPLDIINSPILKAFRGKIKQEISRILKDGRAEVLNNQLLYFPYNSEYPGLQGELSSKLEGKFGVTTLAHNAEANTMSIRGVLTDLVAEELNKVGYGAGGHHGYAGCTDPNKGDILEVLSKIAKKLGRAEVKLVVEPTLGSESV